MGWGWVFFRPWQTGSVCGERLGNRMSSGGIFHGSWNTRTVLNWYLPAGMIPPLGVIATSAEILFGLLLLVGWHTRAAALLSGLLLLTFGVAMTLALGVKAPSEFCRLHRGGRGVAFSQIAKDSHSAWMSCCSVGPIQR